MADEPERNEPDSPDPEGDSPVDAAEGKPVFSAPQPPQADSEPEAPAFSTPEPPAAKGIGAEPTAEESPASGDREQDAAAAEEAPEPATEPSAQGEEPAGESATDKPPTAPPAQAAKHVRVGTTTRILLGFAALLLIIVLVAALLVARIESTQRSLLRYMQQSISVVGSQRSEAAEENQDSDSLNDYVQAVNTGGRLFENGHYKDAAEAYRAALRIQPHGNFSDEAHFRLGVCASRLGDVELALAHLRAVIMHFPGSIHYPRASLELSRILIDRQQYVQARRILYGIIGVQNRIRKDDMDVLEEAHYALGECYEREAVIIEQTHQQQTPIFDLALQGDML